VDNAAKYSPPASPIDIRAQATGEWLEIQIGDRGVGIPAGDLARVFNKFYRVQRPIPASCAATERAELPPGTGLGLSISSSIVEAHGGSIWAENRPGGGTLVTLKFPLVD
jgi:two-component system sensor histidine kinase KdpD